MVLQQDLANYIYTDSLNVNNFSGQSYIVSGCGVSEKSPTPNMNITVAAGVYVLNGTQLTCAGGDVLLTQASSGKYKHAIIRINNSGVLSAVYGNEDTTNGVPPSGALNVPDYEPNNYVALARIKIGNVSSISNNDITDLRKININYQTLIDAVIPIGSVFSWLKTFATADNGTTDSTIADKLVDSTQNFETTVNIGYIVHNITDNTFAYVTDVDSNTTLSLDADIIVSGKTYIIYKTPALNDNWVECNGQVLSDDESIYDGATIPNLNGVSGTKRFLRGSTSSGATGGSETHTHTVVITANSNTGDTGPYDPADADTYTTSATSTLPSYYEVVFILRIK